MRLMIRAACAFAVMSLLVKQAAGQIPSIEIVFFRSLTGTIWILMLCRHKKIPVSGINRPVLILRGLSGGLALWMCFYSISQIHLGNAVILTQTAPIFAAILGIIFLKETLNLRMTALILLAFLGVWCIASPEFSKSVSGNLSGLGSGLCAGIAYLCVSHLKKSDHEYTIIFYFTAISSILTLPGTLIRYVPPTPATWICIGGIFITSLIGQLHLTRALKYGPANTILPFGYLTPVLSALIGCAIWGEMMNSIEITGMILVILSGALIYRSGRNHP